MNFFSSSEVSSELSCQHATVRPFRPIWSFVVISSDCPKLKTSNSLTNRLFCAKHSLGINYLKYTANHLHIARQRAGTVATSFTEYAVVLTSTPKTTRAYTAALTPTNPRGRPLCSGNAVAKARPASAQSSIPAEQCQAIKRPKHNPRKQTPNW